MLTPSRRYAGPERSLGDFGGTGLEDIKIEANSALELHHGPQWRGRRAGHSNTRSTLLTTAFALSPAMMWFKCATSQTSRPILSSVKSDARRTILRLSIFPPAWPMTSAI